MRAIQEYPAGPNMRWLDDVDFAGPIPQKVERELQKAVAGLKKDASTGVPFCYAFKTNEELLDACGEEQLIEVVWDRLRQLAANPDLSSLSAVELVDGGYTDPVRLFVKGELHSTEKVQQQRMRLISILSTADQVIERFLCAGQNRTEIDNWETIPSKPGMGLDDESLDSLRADMKSYVNPVDTDISGWDWAVPGWLMLLEAQVRVALAGCKPGSTYARLLVNRVMCLSLSLMVFSDGTIWEQVVRGIQKSGSYNTSSSNSRMRVLLAYMAGAARACAMGDDCFEEYCEGAAAFYSRHVPVKAYKPAKESDGRMEFCSVMFNLGEDGEPYSSTREVRQLATLLWKTPMRHADAEELIAAFCNDARHSNDYRFRSREAVEAMLARWTWGAGKTN